MKKWGVGLALLGMMLSAGTALAQAPTVLGTFAGTRVAISAPAKSYRVGNAVAMRVHSLSGGLQFGTSAHVLVSCDGKWISTLFRMVFNNGKGLAPEAQEADALAREDRFDADPIDFLSIGESGLKFADQLSRRAAQYCKAAPKEPRNYFIPVARSAQPDGEKRTVSIVTGTSYKAAAEVDVWVRTDHYRPEPIITTEGKPMEIDGVVQTELKPTGEYSLFRTAFDCRQRKLGVYEAMMYDGKKPSPQTESVVREKLRLASAGPDSVGEAQLDAVCTLYGQP